MNPATIPELLSARVRATPNAEAYRQYDSERGVWVSYSWGEIEERIGRWRDALTGEGFPSGARIALLIPNSIEHVCMDQAALSLGFVPVPMHVISLCAEDPATLRAPMVLEWVLEHVARGVRGFPAYAKPRAVHVSVEPWTIDGGLITPTLKPKRLAIEKRFAAEIAELYRGHEAPEGLATDQRSLI